MGGEQRRVASPGEELGRGSAVGRYLVVRPLGEGVDGAAYRAYDPRLDRAVELRVLRAGASAGAGVGELAAVRRIARIVHRNLVEIYDVGSSEGVSFIARELVDGVSLEQWIAQGARTARELSAVLADAGRGLVAIHQAGFAHGAVTMQSVVVDRSGRARVRDAGLAGSDLARNRAPDVGAFLEVIRSAFALLGASAGAAGGDRVLPARLRSMAARAKSGANLTAGDLVAALERAARRRAVGVVAVALCAAGAAIPLLVPGVVGRESAGADRGHCAGSPERLSGVWDERTRDQVRRAFVDTKHRRAEATFERVAQLLDERADHWLTMRREACAAPQLDAASADRFDRQIHCLDRRLSETRALAQVFATAADGELIDKAVSAVFGLAKLEPCADDVFLTAAVAPPEDPVVRDRVAALRRRLDTAAALQAAGKFEPGLEVAREVDAAATEVPYAPFQAEVLFTMGTLQSQAGQLPNAEATLLRAGRAAARARDDRLLARTSSALAFNVGYLQARLEPGLALIPLVEADVERAGGDPDARADALNSAGIIFTRQRRYAEAREHFERALAIEEKRLGPQHPSVGRTLNSLGGVLFLQGRLAEARVVYERALEVQRATIGEEHPVFAKLLNNLGTVADEQGDSERAAQLYEQALAIKEKMLGPDHPGVGVTLISLAIVQGRRGKYASAIAHYRRALDLLERTLGPHHPHVAHALGGLGQCLLDTGEIEPAVELLERAVAIREQQSARLTDLARDQFALARALWALGRQRGRAIELANAAFAAYRGEEGEATRQEQERVRAWLAARRRLAQPR